MRKRRITAAQLKDKRNKKIAGVLSAMFLVVLVVQVPKLMKQMNPSTPAAATSPAAAAPATSASAPATAGSTPVATSSSTGGTLPTAAPAALTNFAKLPFKDPFRALVGVASATTTGSSSSSSTPAKTATKPKSAVPSNCSVVVNSQTEAFICARKKPKATKASASQPAASGTMTFTAKTPPNAAIVKMNGKKQTVFVGDGFPTANPLFKLVALGEKTVRVGIFGGSFTTGEQTIKLAKGKRVTLANKADGSHYVIELVKLTTAIAPVKTTPTSSSSTPSSSSTSSSSGTSTTPSSSTGTTTTSTSTSP